MNIVEDEIVKKRVDELVEKLKVASGNLATYCRPGKEGHGKKGYRVFGFIYDELAAAGDDAEAILRVQPYCNVEVCNAHQEEFLKEALSEDGWSHEDRAKPHDPLELVGIWADSLVFAPQREGLANRNRVFTRKKHTVITPNEEMLEGIVTDTKIVENFVRAYNLKGLYNSGKPWQLPG